MSKIFFIGDTHFGHTKEFLWKPRGYQSSEEHDQDIIIKWNTVVSADDDVYVVGDLMLGDNAHGIECVKQLNGHIHLVRGNHDTDRRWEEIYPNIPNIVEFCDWSTMIKYGKYHFLISHFPTLTGNLEKESLKQMTLNIYAHTHQKTKFYEDRPYMYCVSADAHNCYPVEITQIIEDMEQQVKSCLSEL